MNAQEIARRIVSDPAFNPQTFDIDSFVDALPPEVIEILAKQIAADENRDKYNLFQRLFPDEGPLRRELYPKHIEFFAAGKQYRQRCFMAANRVGKTLGAGYEVTCHLTGKYPYWWPGRVFRRPGPWWVAGDTNETTRDILQKQLLGEVTWAGNEKTFDGSGLIDRECIGPITWKRNVADLADTVKIKHKTGGMAALAFKSYDQGRRVFQGTAKQGIWLDEEVPEDVENECLLRLATTRGMLILSYTPMLGLSKVTLGYLPAEMRPGGAE